ELFISLIKTFLALVCTYIFLQITAVFEPMMEILLSQIYTWLYLIGFYSILPSPNSLKFSIYFYFFTMYVIIWLKIYLDEINKKKYKEKLKNKTIGDFEYLDDYLNWLKEIDKKYESKYAKKLNIFILFMVFFSVFLLMVFPL
ncbi:MAG: hypothetical protein ACTSUG_02535, partial [Candidatus Helarchaeota archaeon]